MLVLRRKVGDSVMIGDCIEVVIVEIRGCDVKIGFHAPPATPIHRRELYDDIKRDRERGTEAA